jgi:hypothetical protein
MAQLLPIPEVLVVVHSVHSARQAALLLRSQCRWVQRHTETEVEILLMVGISTVLVAVAQALLVAIDLMRVTCLPRVAQV